MKIKMFMFAAMAAFVTLAGCSDSGDDEKPVPPPAEETSEYKASFRGTTCYETNVTIEAITENAKSQNYMAVVVKKAFLEEVAYGKTPNAVAKNLIEYFKQEFIPQGATVADIYDLFTMGGELHGAKPVTMPVTELSPDTDYAIVIAGIDTDLKITANALIPEFRTEKLPDSETKECTFELTIKEVTSSSVQFSVIPSDKTVPYFFYVMDYMDYEQVFYEDPAELKEGMLEYISWLAEAYGASVPELMAEMRSTGDTPDFKFTGIMPGTEYILFVCGMDDYGRATTDVVVEKFTAGSYVASNATVKSCKVWMIDGDDASSRYPADFPPKQYAGSYFLAVQPEFSEECDTKWFLLPIAQDLSDMTDAELYGAIMSEGGFVNAPVCVIPGIPEGVTAYVYVVAQTPEGEPGNIFRCPGKQATAANADDVDDLFASLEQRKAAAFIALSSVPEMLPKAAAGVMKVVRAL